jgi:hypothetical protein
MSSLRSTITLCFERRNHHAPALSPGRRDRPRPAAGLSPARRPPVGAPSQGLHRRPEEPHGRGGLSLLRHAVPFHRRTAQGPPLRPAAPRGLSFRREDTGRRTVLDRRHDPRPATPRAAQAQSSDGPHRSAGRGLVGAAAGAHVRSRRCHRQSFRHGDFSFGARRALGRRLASADFSHAYVLPNSWKSALVPYFARIPHRIGYQGESRYLLLNERHRLDPPAIRNWCSAMRRWPAPAGRPAATAAEFDARTTAGGAQGAGPAAAARPVVFCPGAEYGPAKRWPARHFAALARLVATPENPAWLVGSDKDAAVGDEIAARGAGRGAQPVRAQHAGTGDRPDRLGAAW